MADPAESLLAARTALATVTAALDAGEERSGQVAMAEAVAEALAVGRHLVVQAGTGTGKSLAYLVPAVLSGRRVVVATATKALQDQLCGKDLPFLADHLDHPFTVALLKGRSNYVCLQRLDEIEAAGAAGSATGGGRAGGRTGRAAGRGGEAGQLVLDVLAERAPPAELARIEEWAIETTTGDRAELDFEPTGAAWSAVSVSALECPGASRCARGEECFAEAARRAAAAADVVVVNMHLYGMHLASGGVVLPDHDVLVLDEAHQVEAVISDTCGLELGPGRLVALGRSAAGVLADDGLLSGLTSAGTRLRDVLAAERGRRIRRMQGEELAEVLMLVRTRVEAVIAALRKVPDGVTPEVAARKLRALGAATSLVADIDHALEQAGPDVVWVEGTPESPVLRVAPVEVGQVLQDGLWNLDAPDEDAADGDEPDGDEPDGDEPDGDEPDGDEPDGDEPDGEEPDGDDHPAGRRADLARARRLTAVLTSATIPPGLADRLGMDPATVDHLDVGSPFDYEANALLYCAAHLPDPRSAGYEEALHDELACLVEAAGGRTLALFTSWRAMDAAAEALTGRLPGPLLTQRDLPKPALVAAFSEEPAASLFATMGFWQGIDVPGDTLRLVAIDRLPFPRPDEPLLQARRELARAAAFATVDLPIAATLLAQGAGRLIRTATDRGVVAVLDSRLATAPYRWDLVRALPPMGRTRDRDEAVAFLRSCVTLTEDGVTRPDHHTGSG